MLRICGPVDVEVAAGHGDEFHISAFGRRELDPVLTSLVVLLPKREVSEHVSMRRV